MLLHDVFDIAFGNLGAQFFHGQANAGWREHTTIVSIELFEDSDEPLVSEEFLNGDRGS